MPAAGMRVVFHACLCVGQGIDAPLSDVGVRQAEAAGHYLRDLHFTNAFVSNLQRATKVRSGLIITIYFYSQLFILCTLYYVVQKVDQQITKFSYIKGAPIHVLPMSTNSLLNLISIEMFD